MSGWDIVPDGVSGVLTSTGTAGNKIYDALNGSGLKLGLGQIADQIAFHAQSGLIQSALAGYFTSESGCVTSIVSRVQGVMNATVKATNAVIKGDESMAASIQSSMSTACQSGDFSAFLEGEQ